jgi:hypothetical protein
MHAEFGLVSNYTSPALFATSCAVGCALFATSCAVGCALFTERCLRHVFCSSVHLGQQIRVSGAVRDAAVTNW